MHDEGIVWPDVLLMHVKGLTSKVWLALMHKLIHPRASQNTTSLIIVTMLI